MPDHAPIAWLFSMIRSGSSIAAYAAASPFGGVVADEIFGPWVRTGPYYRFPPEQGVVTELFRTSVGVITPEIARAAGVVFEKLARGEAGLPVCAPGREGLLERVPPGGRRIVVKMPHDHPAPGEVRRVWPDHPHVFVLRNPIDRLSSIILRGMLPVGSSGGAGTCITENWDLPQLRQFCGRWLEARGEGRGLVYDDIRRDPRGFFEGMYRAWGWQFEAGELEGAAAYAASNYHAMSIQRDSGADTQRPVSSQKRAAPEEAIRAYLTDSVVVAAMREAGWGTEIGAYLGSDSGAG